MHSSDNKVAVVLHGSAGRHPQKIKGLPADAYYGLNSLKTYLNLAKNCDVFCHLWSEEASKEVLDFLNPTAMLVSRKHSFDSLNFINVLLFGKKRGFKLFAEHVKNVTLDFRSEKTRASNILSRWLSASLALQLLETHMQHFSKTYRWVILTRYDLELFNEFDFNLLNENKIYLGNNTEIFDKNGQIIPNCEYWKRRDHMNLSIRRKNFNQGERGVEDLFIIATPEKIMKLTNLYHDAFSLAKSGVKMNSHHLLEYFLIKNFGLIGIDFYKDRIVDFDLSRRKRLGYID